MNMIHTTPDVAAQSRLPQSPTNPSPKRNRPIRLANTKGLDREQWLAVRQQGIGGSDAAAAVGLNPYQSMLELWMIKTGRQQPDADPQMDALQSDDSHPMYWGKVLEPIVAQHYQSRTGHKVRRINATLQHPDIPWMIANVDYRVSGSPDVAILECKTAGEFGARLWNEGVPYYIQIQVQHQLAVTGEQAADVAVLICGQRLKIYRIHRDDGIIASLIELEREFWHYVETDTPPPADGSDSAQQALQRLYPRDSGLVIDWQDNEVLSAAFDALLEVRTELEVCQQQEDVLKQRIQQAMGDASQAVFARGAVSWKRSKDSISLDSKRLLKDQPQLLEQYGVTREGSRRFVIQAKPSTGSLSP